MLSEKAIRHRENAFRRAYSLQLLRLARDVARKRDELVTMAEMEFGNEGSLIAGCHREHFPDGAKDILRHLAREFSRLIDESLDQYQSGHGTRAFWIRHKDSILSGQED